MSAVRERVSRLAPAAGLIAQLLLLAVLVVFAGLGPVGEVVGVLSAVTMAAALARGLAHRQRLGPASWVTLARATLAVGVAALAADSLVRTTPVALLVTFAAVALALDAADGWVARRTGTATALGARFDGEVDAFLILALSVYVAPTCGAWVLAIGLARYVFLAGEWLLPWMRPPVPPRRWRKLVAATQGIVLTVAAAGVLPLALAQALLVVALALLAASVAQCVWWLWQHRHAVPDQAPAGDAEPPRRGPLRAGLAVALTVARPAARLGRARRAERAEPPDRGRVRAAPARAPRRRRPGRPAARHPAPRAGRARRRGAQRRRRREGPGHRLLHRVRPAVQARRRLELPGDRHRDPPRRDRQVDRGPRRRGRRRARRRAPRRPGARAAARDAGRGRAPRLGAPDGGGAVRGLGGAPDRRRARCLGERRRPGRRRGARGADRAPGARGARPRDRARPLPRHARRPAADRAARQGRPARVRRELRAGRRPGLVVLAPGRRRARPGRRAAAVRRLRVAQRVPHLADVRRPQLAGALHPAVRGPDRRAAGLRPARRSRPPHPHQGVQARGLARGRRHAREPPGVAGGIVLLPLRPDLRSPQPRLPRPGLRPAADARPVHVRWRCSGASSPSVPGRRSSPRSTSSRATRRGRASPG